MRVSVKLIVCYIVTVVALFAIVNFVGVDGYEKSLVEEAKVKYTHLAEMFAQTISPMYENKRVTPVSDSELTLSVVRMNLASAAESTEVRLFLTNSSKQIIADTLYKNSQPYSNFDNFDISLLDKGVSEHIDGQGLFSEPMIFISVPIMSRYEIRGYLCMAFPESRFHEQALESMDTVNRCLLWSSLVILAAFVMLFLIMVLPIRKIRKAAVEYSKGNYDYKMNIRSHDEFKDLSDTMKFMVDKLSDTEERQKKFIANISHDFRSPLTSIKGYAEAIKDGTIPYENKDKYLDIILFESERLHKLTSSILELNTMDNGKMALEIRSFDITRIIRTIADTFEGTCRKKKITIRLLFDDYEIYVEGDMGRIEQVIYNLLDNAIKFSEADSEIIIGVQIKGGKAYVRVKDFGCGISKESLTKIWDRFYKSDESRGKDKKGTGLGLSIVKEIIQAHGENINVVSTKGVGTEFTFTLRLA